MAKYGEGDERWIVKDRADGANVDNWHWAETDCLEWSRNLLSNLLSGLTITDGEDNLFIKTKKVEKIDGEAYINVRKRKIIPSYEISVTLSWEGEAKDSDGSSLLKAEGLVEIPYISVENAGEEPELKASIKDEGPHGRRLKEVMHAKGKPLIFEKVRVYMQAMAKGGPAKDELEAKKIVPKAQSTVAAVAATETKEPVVEKKAADKKEAKKGFKKITLREKFSCRARNMYEILMDENRWKGFTLSNAKISKEVGGVFSIFDGSVTGTILELQDGKLIVLKWRFANWAAGIHSTVKLALDEPEPGVTVVKLAHTGIPEEDRYGNATVVENTERGWRDLIFNRIRAVFGFGI